MRYLSSKMNVFGNLPHIIDPAIPQICVELVVSILNHSQVLNVKFVRPSELSVIYLVNVSKEKTRGKKKDC